MSQENMEIVRRAVEMFNESGVNGPVLDDLFADDAEFHEPPEQPAPRVAHGREEVRRLFGEFESACPFAAIFTLRDKRIVRWEAFWDPDRALAELGGSDENDEPPR